jgi:dipeptidyl aminopeptidase/acylaminoacyl peptidase
MQFRSALYCVSAFLAAGCLGAQTAGTRLLTLDDFFRFHEVNDPQVSPDGQWIAYTVSTIDKEADKRHSNIWLVSPDGAQNFQATFDLESESSPRWSPDNKYLAFLSSRPGKAKGSQVWILDRRGGEARQLTDVKGKLSAFLWAPDSKRLGLVMRESDEPPEDAKPEPGKDGAAKPKPPKPIVIDRYHFKQDMQGYLSGPHRSRLYLFEIESRKLALLTDDNNHDEANPAWSPDGSKIAFVSNHDPEPDRTDNTDVFVTEARAGSTPRKLTSWQGPDGGRLAWSPDSKLVAYQQGSEPKYSAYSLNRLAVAPVDGGPPRVLTQQLDRGVSSPIFSADGKSVRVLVADDRSEYPAVVSLANGSVERLAAGPIVVLAQSQAGGHTAMLASSDNAPAEIFSMDGGGLRKLTSHNSSLISELRLGSTEDITFKSKDGAEVHGLLTKPPAFEAGRKYPTLLRIHGGPNGQDQHSWAFERQLFAAHGYVVLAVNYRGSAGRGSKYGESIFSDWGNKEVADLLAGVDQAVAIGVADPDRLGIGGWSYGGILTDYVIATDQRFKCAISGAGSANQIAMYGTDQYTFQYDNEIGPPWRNPEGWMKVSYPFFKADRIHTPTLFMGGEKDFNVPIVGGEQMYQALRTLGVPTQLVIYPGEFHGFTRPSFVRDRYERYLAWYDKYLMPPVTTTATGSR